MYSMLHRIATVIFFASLASGCLSVPSCKDSPQHTRPQPSLVSEYTKQLPNIERSTEQERRYAYRMQQLRTKPWYHDIVLHPRATLDAVVAEETRHTDLAVAGPVFLIGLEKPRGGASPAHVQRVRDECKGRDFTIDNASADKRIRDTICDVLDDGRPQLLTHVAQIDGVKAGRYGDVHFLYNLYDSPIQRHKADLHPDEALYGLGLDALARLRIALHEALAKGNVTDIVVLSTGWNTRQRETLYNTLDWMASIGNARAGQSRPYRPIYITISWQSSFENQLLKLISASVTAKANDADELGLTWINRLLHDAVIPEAADNELPVTLVGHSFGARVLGSALYLRNAIDRPTRSKFPSTAFIALQPAFPINRYGRSRGKERWFAEVDPHALVVLTSSKNDKATSLLPWGRYAGGGGAVERVITNRKGNLADFGQEVLVAGANGRVPDASRLTSIGAHLINANAFVTCNMPNSGGGAHSDVYDASAGCLIAQAMDAASGVFTESSACRAVQ